MTGAEIWIWLASNPWRTAALGLMVALLVCAATIKITTLNNSLLRSELELERQKVAEIQRLGEQQQENIDAANKQLEELRKARDINRQRIADLLKNWPADCDNAADRAIELVRGGKK